MEARTKCRLTGGQMVPVFDLGSPCVSDFVPPGTEGIPFPLAVAVGREWPHLPQLTHSYPPEAMYRRYHYRSGTNEAMRRELRDVVERTQRLRPVGSQDWVLDIACNDGTLLKQWLALFSEREEWIPNLVGIDPSDVAGAEPATFFHLVNDFFSEGAYRRITDNLAAVVTCVAMFYDLDDPVDFLNQVRRVMRDDGLFVLQVHHAGILLDTNAFDAICHEHLAYYNGPQLAWALHRAGLEVVDAEITSSNGGSIRIFAMPTEAATRYAYTIEGMAGAQRWQAILMRDYARYGNAVTAEEQFANNVRVWEDLALRVGRIGQGVREFLWQARDQEKTVVGYGASTKGNTLLQYWGIGPDLLPCIADRQEHKIGLVTAGSGIPIISEAEMRTRKPDYLFVLPWHFLDNFSLREKDLLQTGTKLVAPLPELTVWDDCSCHGPFVGK